MRKDNVPAARDLRGRTPPSEQLLWEQLRSRRFLGLKFRRQHPIGPFVLDFYCEELKLAIEVDGGVHLARERARYDRQRQKLIEDEGITFVRITADDVERDIEEVLRRIATQLPSPPSPLP